MVNQSFFLRSGATLTNRDTTYTIGDILGSGGFGITYHATYDKEVKIQEKFQKVTAKASMPVAIKELFIEGKCIRQPNGETIGLQSLPGKDFQYFKDRFLQEAETLSKFMDVEHLAHVIDFFEANNTAYMVMEFVEGQTLRQKVKEHGILSDEEALEYVKQIATALQAVHEANMLHRDIKPDNIIVTPNDQLVLIDFGAAREFVVNMTVTNSVVLTPGYAPIEQYGQKRRRGPYTDIYAIGGTLYFCVSGHNPPAVFDREPGDQININEASDKINELLAKCMAMKGEDRFQSCQELMDDIIDHDYIKNEAGKVGEANNNSEETAQITSSEVTEYQKNTEDQINAPQGTNASPVNLADRKQKQETLTFTEGILVSVGIYSLASFLPFFTENLYVFSLLKYFVGGILLIYFFPYLALITLRSQSIRNLKIILGLQLLAIVFWSYFFTILRPQVGGVLALMAIVMICIFLILKMRRNTSNNLD